MVEDFLKAKHIEFTHFDVSSDREKLQEMMRKSGQSGVPVIVIGKKVIVGFDKPKIIEALGIEE